ncbi:histidine kinase [Brachybacterium muris]|uniref:sensor histidine kinase n=1 Tax=Brachybacterium muris TaxID=219301 RepID=UPI0021E420CC|nr:histidine kinase [Brachybacterium muris]MCT1429263.1 histidine kinase [Brachybacterium muris]MCT2296292.1 histidine kinase [Brachybacterium muris]
MEATAPTSLPPDPRLRIPSLATVIVEGLLALLWGWVSITLLLTGVGSLFALGSGLLLLVPWVVLMQLAIRFERHRAAGVHGIDVVVPARRRSTRSGLGGWLHGLWLDVSSWPFWRGVLHHHVAMLVASIALVLFLSLVWLCWVSAEIAIVHGAVTLGSSTVPVWALALISVAALALAVLTLVLGALADRGLARAMISGSAEDLREQVLELTQRRQGAVDAAAQERARIERDLHDGVQPRLVAMAMTLGIAKGMIATDPDRATALVGEAHAEAKGIITDLRQLARGIHPAVLEDRGLDAALSALAARSPVPVDLSIDLTTPLGREREAVAYFVVAEALTNIAKHAGATRARVDLTEADGTVRVRIEDDGRGGAQVHRDGVSTGLAGLTDRVRATGGRLEVSSPTSPPGTTQDGTQGAGPGTVLLALIPLDARPGIPATAAPATAVPTAAAPTTAAPTTEETLS